MLSYKKYKKIYPNINIWKWLWNQIPYYFRRMYRIPYCTYMCIRYPFLYPRNRFTDKHTVGLLNSLRSNLYNSSIMEVTVTGKLMKENTSFTDELSVAGISAKLNITDKTLIITNNNEQKVYDLTDLLWRDDRFEILGISPFVNMFSGNPTIIVHVKTRDENDNTNYGFSYNRVLLIKSNFKNKFYKVVKWFDEKILDRILFLPTYTEWDAVEPGWNKAFGKQYLKELKTQLKKDKMLYKWRITQIKEKWGRWVLYCNYGSHDLYKIIHKYEDISWNTCIKCGKPATYTSRGWIAPYCHDCVVNSNEPNRYILRGTKEEKNYLEHLE